MIHETNKRLTKLLEDIENPPDESASPEMAFVDFLREKGLEATYRRNEFLIEGRELIWEDGGPDSLWELDETFVDVGEIAWFLADLIRTPLRHYIVYDGDSRDCGVWYARGENEVTRKMYEELGEDEFPDIRFVFMLELPVECEDLDTGDIALITTVAAIEHAWVSSPKDWPYDGSLEDDQRVCFRRSLGPDDGTWSVDIEIDPTNVDGWAFDVFAAKRDEVLSIFEKVSFRIWLIGRLAEEGMGPLELAARSGVPKSTITRYTDSHGSLTRTELAAISDVLGPYESASPHALHLVDTDGPAVRTT